MKFKEKFQVWPDWSIKDVAPAAYPTVPTLSWIKHGQIKWAKSKNRKEAANA
jgi:hypothetical protein